MQMCRGWERSAWLLVYDLQAPVVATMYIVWQGSTSKLVTQQSSVDFSGCAAGNAKKAQNKTDNLQNKKR